MQQSSIGIGAHAMIEIKRSVTTGTARDLVAAFLSDFTTTAQWDPNTKSCEQIDSGPITVGTEYDNTQKVGPGSTTLRYRVARYAPGTCIELHSSSTALNAVDRMEFADAPGGGTTVTYIAQFDFTGPVKLGEPVLRKQLEKIADEGAAGMQRELDALPPMPRPADVGR